MRIIDLIKKLEDLYCTYDDEYKHTPVAQDRRLDQMHRYLEYNQEQRKVAMVYCDQNDSCAIARDRVCFQDLPQPLQRV